MQVFQTLFVCAIAWFLIVLVSINMITGCESWGDQNCVTPMQIVGW